MKKEIKIILYLYNVNELSANICVNKFSIKIKNLYNKN